MVRQITLDFLFKEKGNKLVTDTEETSLAMAFILAESNKKGKAKLKFLSPVAVPFWIVQISDTNSIVLSAIGESSMKMELSEDTATGPVKRILSTEIVRYADIPDGVDKALPLLRNVEPKVQQIRNVQKPDLFVTQGYRFREVDPNEDLNSLELKIDSQMALNASQEFQTLIEGARQRLDTMEGLRKITQEKLTDQRARMENAMTADMSRWEKRLNTQEESSKLRIVNLQERMSEKIYNLKDKHQKDRKTILAEFTRDSFEIEKFFTQVIEDIKIDRESLNQLELEEAIDKYRSMVDNLSMTVPTYTDVIRSLDDLADSSIARSGDLEFKLGEDIKKEEESVDDQIKEIQAKLEDMREEMSVKNQENKKIQEEVTDAIERMDSSVKKRVDALRRELERVQKLTLENDSVKGLTPLTLVHIHTWVATYTTGKPIVFPPIIMPEDRIGLPYSQIPLDTELEKFLRKTVNKQMKDSASFKTSFRNACVSGNILKKPESIKTFNKGIDNIFKRQLLKDGVRDKLEPFYTKLVGKCPECGAEITSSSKFCPECGKSLK
ncbi:MAG: zinc-ribbon domain-containing protein [Candidatus Thorarchaeota archaeon]